MNEDNPPMVAPSGAVYSEKALSQIAAQHNGMFKDPETGVCVQFLASAQQLYIFLLMCGQDIVVKVCC